MGRSTARQLTDGTLRVYEMIAARQVEDLSPKVMMALRLLVHSVVRTQNEAAAIAGISPAYFSRIINSPAGKTYMKSAQNIIEENAHDTNLLIKKLSHRAIEVIGTMMEDAGKEDIRLRAAQDLADRGPETAKIQKHQVESFTLSGADARAIAESMVQAARVKQDYAALKTEDFIRVNSDVVDDAVPVMPVQLTLMEP